jgi:hypothetical protein
MSREYGESSSNKTILIVVGIIAGVLLVIVAGCLGAFYLFIQAMKPAVSSMIEMANDMQLAPAAAEAFLSDIAADRLDTAYERTSANYQKRQDLEAFRKLVAKYPAFKNSSATVTNMQMAPGRCTFQFTTNGANGSVSCRVVMIKEEESWKVDQFTVP